MLLRPIVRFRNATTHRSMFQILVVLALLISFAASSYPCAAMQAEELTSGTSGRQFKEQAIQSIPYAQLNAQTKQKLTEVTQKTSIYRRLPLTEIDIDPDYLLFLVRHPEVVVNIWQLMGVTKMSTKRTSPFAFSTDDGVGTLSNVELVYGTNNMHIFYGTGSYEGNIIRRKLTGRCVLILRTDFKKDAAGNSKATNQLDVFLKVDNATAGLVAKTLNPIVGKTADHNFVESLNFLERLNQTTTKNGPGVQQMAGRLTDINNDVRQQFIKTAGIVYQRSGGAIAPPANQLPPNKTQRPSANYPAGYQQPYSPAQGQPAGVAGYSRAQKRPVQQPTQYGTGQYPPGQEAQYARQYQEAYSARPPRTAAHLQTGYAQPSNGYIPQYPASIPPRGYQPPYSGR